MEKKVFWDKAGDSQGSTHNFFQVGDFLWSYIMLLYLFILVYFMSCSNLV